MTARELAWWRALDLEERLGLLGDPTEVDGELGRRRIERWRQAPFDDADLWQQRLALDGLDERRFERLLGETQASLRERAGHEPEWSRETRSAFTSTEASEPFAWPEGSNLERAPFLPLVETLVRRAHRRLEETARRLAEEAGEAPLYEPRAAADALVAALPDLLAPIMNRAMVVELHVAKLEERLEGDTGEERFASFVALLRDPDTAWEILSRYPVLARQLWQRIDQWRRASSTFLEHLVADAGLLRQRLAGGDGLGHLVEATGGVSDPHRDGRGVLLLRFDSGFRVAYKPKSMAVEAAFQELLDFFGERGLEPRLRAVQVLDRGDRGWMEFVEAAACESAEELRRFYLRQGAYLALLYLLDGTDFHHENLIAAGENPIFVDLETLFQPWVNVGDFEAMDRQPGTALRGTVVRTDLLPSRWWATEDEAGIDMSGLASREGQLTPQPVVAMTDRGTDSMRVERRRVEVPTSDNRPSLDGQEVSVYDYRGELEEGFRRLYALAVEHRDILAAEDGPLAAFARAEVRVLFRTTASYGTILLESYHPHLQGDALERDRLLDRLWHAVLDRPFLEHLIHAERREMARGDIPLFVTHPETRKAFTWDGETLAVELDAASLHTVLDKLAAFGDADRRRQLAIVHDAFEVVRLTTHEPPRPTYDFQERPEPASAAELLEAAEEIGERLLARAFQTEHEALWLAVDYAEPAGWRLAPTGPDVFQGLPGIAFFFGYLGAVTGDRRYTSVARRALWAQRQQIESDPGLVRGLGTFNGWGGVIYVLTHLGVLWGDPELLAEAETYARRLPEEVKVDDLLDMVAGSAGCLVALLELHRHRPESTHLLETARLCGERLLETTVEVGEGHGWRMPLAGNRVLAGMSHGAAGIALALLRLHDATGDDRYHEAAQGAFRLERQLYDPELRNWPDLRQEAAAAGMDGVGNHEDHHEMVAWCHGAPGVGLARLAGLDHADDPEIRAELDAAVHTTLARGLGNNHCLCHGDLGNLDFLLSTARRLGDTELELRVGRLTGGVLESLRRDGPLFGLP
ncbi:MAG: type 2 lantipeptide synthetase LanM family protein, partial [Holophagales bacterium]|nr:type 2 lantipeptide synthetase LanM family protein [Holophagales bacterium]